MRAAVVPQPTLSHGGTILSLYPRGARLIHVHDESAALPRSYGYYSSYRPVLLLVFASLL